MRELDLPVASMANPPEDVRGPLELHQLTTRLLQCNNVQAAAEEMLDAMIEYHGADFGNLQFLETGGDHLKIVAQRGFSDRFLETFRTVSPESPSACGRALRQRKIILIDHVADDPELAPYSAVMDTAGIQAVQSTPLIAPDGKLVGIISTHFNEPRLPTVEQLSISALYAQQGAILLKRLQFEQPAPERTVKGRQRVGTTGDDISSGIELSPLYRKLNQFHPLNADELSTAKRLIREVRECKPDTQLISEGEPPDECFIMLAGWGCKYKFLDEGTRQIIHFPIPGDFAGIHGRLFRQADHSFSTITAAKVGVFLVDELQEFIESHPRIGQAVLWASARDEAIMVEHLINLGRRNAVNRVAHFLIEIGERMKFAGLIDDGKFSCPITQDELADALGLTSIHVNRVLRQLRERELVTLSKGRLRILSTDKLAALASYNSEYLDQEVNE